MRNDETPTGLTSWRLDKNVREYKDDTRKIVKFISAPGQLVHCPFNPAHLVKCCKVEVNFRKYSKACEGLFASIVWEGRQDVLQRASAGNVQVQQTPPGGPRDMDQHQSFCPCAPADIKLRAAAAADPPVSPV
ncbi:hypothetical protein Bbelb_050320 [Branchiostoma belcheri]|nr:hypothetical protein Bbelb_050320 [Branchiostoma belcheri]